MTSAEMQDLADRVKALSPADKLRVAASLIETKTIVQVRLGYTIASSVVVECGAVLAVHDLAERADQ